MDTNGDGNAGVFELLTDLCNKTAANCNQSKIPQTKLANKMRSLSYELILKKSTEQVSVAQGKPIVDLLAHYFISRQNAKNIAEYKRAADLKRLIGVIRRYDFGENTDHVYNVLKLLVGLKNTVKYDLSQDMYKNPFTFGLLDEMLPKLPQESFGSPQPYSYYPSHFFELPYSLKNNASKPHEQIPEYIVESFDSTSLLPDNRQSQMRGSIEIKSFCSPMSLASLSTSYRSPYSDTTVFSLPPLTAPRDLKLPDFDVGLCSDAHAKVSYVSNSVKSDMKEVYRARDDDQGSVDIWEIASQIDKDVPKDIWEIAAKLPPVNERQLIASSSREMALWRDLYRDVLSDLNIISEKQFIRHIMYLIIGVDTKSFPFCEQTNCFYMKDGLVLEGISKESLKGYVSPLLMVGTYYKRLYKFAFNQTLEDHFHSNGLVYEAAREVARTYLLEFRLTATKIFEDCFRGENENLNFMPTLLQILYHLEPLQYEIETMASVYKLVEPEPTPSLPYGAELMSYFFNEISLVTHVKTAATMFNCLFSLSKVYFKFIERFIFEGELDDRYNEFFIRKDLQYVNSKTKRYWDKGFYITQSVAIPEFLKSLAKLILLCGKSLRLLKLCNPSDPLILLISSDHPSVKCCASFDELERQQEVLDVYRTRCLFVSGEPVTFDQILLKREAEKKDLTEIASLKQAETLEKIVAERKRLAQLIIAEKQHSLRILEAAMAEAKAAKSKAKQREKKLNELERKAEEAKEEVDSRLRVDERNKIMEYYSKLNVEVEKSKLHTEWKIKRLQLDQSRMQLLSSEERNLKREKLELEHQKNEEIMAMSIQSDCKDVGDDDLGTSATAESTVDDNSYLTASEAPIRIIESEPSIANVEFEDNKSKAQSSTDVFSAICSVAKSIFGVSKSTDDKNCDNKKPLDAQGNIVPVDSEGNSDITRSMNVASAEKLEAAINELEYFKTRQDALHNKQKVISHRFGKTDQENNQIESSFDQENNLRNKPLTEAMQNKIKVLGTEFGIIEADDKEVIKSEPVTEAHKEALINKQKVMGVEYNLPLGLSVSNEPANIAQDEAITNKHRILGSEFDITEQVKIIVKEPTTDAQKEAVINKQKILGVEYNLPLEFAAKRGPQNAAQESALANRIKFTTADMELTSEDVVNKREPQNFAQEAAVQNRIKSISSDIEGVSNKQKKFEVEYNLPLEFAAKRRPQNAAQESALANRIKSMTADMELTSEDVVNKREPQNFAQEAAVQNRIKSISSSIEGVSRNAKREPSKRSGLTLNLRPYSERSQMSGVSPNTALTPGDMFSGLELETPTTADIPLEGAVTADIFTPRSEDSKNIEMENMKEDKEFLTSKGFDFSVMVDETDDSDLIQPNDTSNENSPSKIKALEVKNKHSFFNLLDDTYRLDNFDPFGVKDLKNYSKNYFSNKMDLEIKNSFYTHPAITMEEVKKKPYMNIFITKSTVDVEEKITDCVNIATLTACLQRSVMLPLTYQLEVVNNSILTYFLVDIDMYEHLRSLKDYFFLMDGEFSRSICNNLFAKLVKTLNPQELLNFSSLHDILDKALGSSISQVNKFSENLSFTITDCPLSFQHSSPDVLQCLSLTYAVSWPLNIILSQEALIRYAKVFQFLIKMRRIGWVLGQDFEDLKLAVKLSRPRTNMLLRSPQYISLQIYRHIMASLIRSLDNYIVTTCILTTWTEFENDLKKARTLDDLYECHVLYVKKVLFRCLLNNRSTPVMKLLNDIFTVILKFSRVLKAGQWHQKEADGFFTHLNYTQLEELFHLFEKLAKYLHKVITKLMECGYQRHLVELLTIVNFNGYYNYDKPKYEHNTSLQSSVK